MKVAIYYPWVYLHGGPERTLADREIASALGLARGAIGTTLARARKRLVESYRAREAEEARRNAAS